MPRPLPPNLHKEITRHGKDVWYVRVGQGKRTRIRETYGTPEFKAAYRAALDGTEAPKATRKPGVGTIAWAIGLYRNSTDWAALSPATRRQRDNIFANVKNGETGAKKLADISRRTIVAAQDRRASTPAAARHLLATLRGLFIWAVKAELMKSDPTAGLAAKAPKTDGHPVWTEEDIAAYEKRWPLGTRERVAFDILLHTGLRRGDAVLLGRQHIKGGVIRLKTEKTGEQVAIVVSDELQASIEAGPCGDLTFIVGSRGRARVKEAFGEWFRVACHAAGVRKSAHGLRKAAATRDANDGFSERELEAKYGWRGGRMASHYTRSADRERLSIAAAERQAKRRAEKVREAQELHEQNQQGSISRTTG